MSEKSALALINDYSGDSSDDDIPGPRVSTKRSWKCEENDHSSKRLPVPEQFINKGKIEQTDDPSLHEGRVRSFAHERGNWASFVYVPFQANIGIAQLFSIMEETIPSHMSLKISEDFHISLTKTVILKYHWIQPFVKTLKDNLQYFRKFVILFDSVQVYCNEEKTRTFLGLQIRSGQDTLLKLVDTLDSCLEEYELSPFYKNPSFHMSIAWCVGDVESEVQTFLPEINSKLELLMNENSQDNWYIIVESLRCKIGNKLFQFMLS